MDGINLITALIKVIILYWWRGSRSGAKQLETQQKSSKFKMHQLPHDPSFQCSTKVEHWKEGSFFRLNVFLCIWYFFEQISA